MKTTEHDHDMIAEDRPTPEPTFREIDLADVVIGQTIVEYRCATTDNEEFTDHNWQTRRESLLYPIQTSTRWIDPEPFETALDAIESASMYLHYDNRLTAGEVELHAANIHAQAALTKIRIARS
jgi:hypothetical protein